MGIWHIFIDRLKKHSCKPGTQQFLRSNKPDAKSATNFSVRTFFFFLFFFVELNARQNWKFTSKRNCSVFLFNFFEAKDLFVRSFVCSLIRVSLFVSFTDAHSRTLFHLPTSTTTQLSAPIFFALLSTLVVISFSYTLNIL